MRSILNVLRAGLLRTGGALAVTLVCMSSMADEVVLGEWSILWPAGDLATQSTLRLGETAGAITNDLGAVDIRKIEIDGNRISFEVVVGDPNDGGVYSFVGHIDEDDLAGVLTTDFGELEVVGTRKQGASPLGAWEIESKLGDEQIEAVLILEEEDGTLVGVLETEDGDLEAKDIRYRGNQLSFEVTLGEDGETITFVFAGAINGNEIEGEIGTVFGDFPFYGAREVGPTPVGEWVASANISGQLVKPTIIIWDDGGNLEGTYDSGDHPYPLEELTFEDGALRFVVTTDFGGKALGLSFEGEIDEQDLSGELTVKYEEIEIGTFPMEGTRQGSGENSDLGFLGEWALVTDFGGEIVESVFTLKEEDGKLHGVIAFDDGELPIKEPFIEGDTLVFGLALPEEDFVLEMGFSGTIQDGKLIGELESEFGAFAVTGSKL